MNFTQSILPKSLPLANFVMCQVKDDPNNILFLDYSLIEETSANETVLDDAVFAKPKLPVGKPRQTSTQLHMQFEDEISDENTLLDQYLNHESTRISQFGEAPKGKPNLDDVTQGGFCKILHNVYTHVCVQICFLNYV